MRYLLFSECLQNDFVAPLPAGAPLPNELHIGRAESRRLLGDPDGAWAEEGPLARFLQAWQRGAGGAHASVHIRDWHDPDDPATRAHLEHFGRHCVRGTPGAAFVAPLVEAGGIVVDRALGRRLGGRQPRLRQLPGDARRPSRSRRSAALRVSNRAGRECGCAMLQALAALARHAPKPST
jgi:hypothetical protein